MKTIISIDGVPQEKEIPTTWHEVDFKTFLALAKCGNDKIKQIAVITGIEEEVLRKAEVHNVTALMAAIAFLDQELKYTMPTFILGYPVPIDLETRSVAQYADLEAIIKTFSVDGADPVSQYPLICATYAVVPYDFKEAEKLAERFMTAPCMEVMAIGNFTLVKFLASKQSIKLPSLPVAIPPNRLRRALISWLQTLDSTIRYYLWKRSLPSNERSYLNGR